jgi:hypothetical protein
MEGEDAQSREGLRSGAFMRMGNRKVNQCIP